MLVQREPDQDRKLHWPWEKRIVTFKVDSRVLWAFTFLALIHLVLTLWRAFR